MTELMRRRRALMGAKGGGNLPSAYQQVEWIGGQEAFSRYGGPAIKTGIYPKISTVIRCSMMRIGYEQISGYYGALFGTYSPTVSISANPSTNALYITFGDKIDQTLTVNMLSDFVEITMDKTSATVGGLVKTYNASTLAIDTSRGISILARTSSNNGLERFSNSRCKFFQIYDDDVLQFDGIPCYRKSDGEIGMYDLVSETFLTNAGTGTFTKGADVN